VGSKEVEKEWRVEVTFLSSVVEEEGETGQQF
jgi:hypothetical protein